MLASINRQCSNLEDNENTGLATLLDPCFKDKFFTGIMSRMNAKDILIKKMEELELNSHAGDSSNQGPPGDDESPPPKQPKQLFSVLQKYWRNLGLNLLLHSQHHTSQLWINI